MKAQPISCAYLVVALLSPGLGFSQTVNATILGAVKDIGGGVIAGAKVTITETNTGIAHSSQTNESGNYTFPDVPPGVHQVSVGHSGFKTESRIGIVVVVNSTARVDLNLSPGNVSETVEVTGAPPLLQTEGDPDRLWNRRRGQGRHRRREH